MRNTAIKLQRQMTKHDRFWYKMYITIIFIKLQELCITREIVLSKPPVCFFIPFGLSYTVNIIVSLNLVE